METIQIWINQHCRLNFDYSSVIADLNPLKTQTFSHTRLKHVNSFLSSSDVSVSNHNAPPTPTANQGGHQSNWLIRWLKKALPHSLRLIKRPDPINIEIHGVCPGVNQLVSWVTRRRLAPRRSRPKCFRVDVWSHMDHSTTWLTNIGLARARAHTHTQF